MINYLSQVPKRFFSKLNSKNSNLYINTLLNVYEYFKNETLNLRSDFSDVVDALAFFFEKENASLLIIDDEEDKEIKQSNYKEMARTVLNLLSKEEIGWFYVEAEASDGFYSKYIEITPYASRLADFINDIYNINNAGFNKAIVDIYRNANELSNENSKIRQPYQDGLSIMFKDSNTLALDLKRLNTDVRKFIQLTASQANDYESITGNIIFFANSPFLRDFFRFCDPDNLIYYKEETVKCLRIVLKRMDEELVMDCQLAHLEQEGKEITEEEAVSEIKNKINKIIEFLQDDIQKIINIIRRKIITYSTIINQQLSLKRNADTETAQKKVEDFLQYIVKNHYNGKLDGKELPDDLLEVFSFNSLKYLSEDSMYTTKAASPRIKEALIQQSVEMTEDEIAEFKKDAYRGAYNPYSAKKCTELVNKYLKDKESINVSDLPMDDKEDEIKAVMIYIYGDEGNYEVIEQEGEYKKGFITIQNYIIKKREEYG